ncbi:MAG TPA: MEDS domain-containing protein [Thermodesulfobacteriota bacterium]|nr:MEDS domain-containing protein [Thermodesulfobacteriota bacterium]
MGPVLRETGTGVTGDVPWGSHFCQFYRSQREMMELLVPYLRAGLRNNELFLWVTKGTLGAKQAYQAAKKSLPRFEQYLRKGQVEIIPHTEWFFKKKKFHPRGARKALTGKHDFALERGYKGLRVASDLAWLKRGDWGRFVDYEEIFGHADSECRIITLCLYPLDGCGTFEIMDLLRNHRFALIKRGGRWERIESSDQKEAEKKIFLQTSLLDQTRSAVMATNIEGKVVFWNKFAERLFQRKEEEVLGKNVSAILSPHRVTTFKQSSYWEGELIGERKDGSLFPMFLTNTILRDPRGKVAGMVLAANDMTKQKEAESLLRQSEEKYRALFEESKDAIFIFSPEGRFVDMNPAGVELLGYASKEDLFQTDILKDLYVRPEKKKEIEQVLADQGFVQDVELELKKKSGEGLVVLETATAVRDEHGVMVAYRGILRNVTDVKKLEAQLLQSKKMEAVGFLVGGVAHDFNNTLMVILGNIEIGLKKMESSHSLYDVFLKIREGARKAADLTQQLLAFSRQQMLQPRAINVADLINNLSKRLQRLVGDDVELKVESEPGSGPVVADAGSIEQALIYLTVHGRKAMPQGGTLSLQARNVHLNETFCRCYPDVTPGDYAEISVVDTGMGMDEETLNRVFDPFLAKGEGEKGLELAAVYGMVRQNGGHIIVSSQLGVGSRFHIYLPLRTDPAAHELSGKAGKTFPRGKETILIAEDEREVRELFETFLGGLGYNILSVADGEEAIQAFAARREQIDLVILDAMMPKCSGPKVYEQMQALSPGLPCLFVTGYSEEILKKYFNGDLEVPVLRKPTTFQELGKKVREVLDHKRKVTF